ncbi:hypothetical protein [Blastococcus sp. PRF04-17]|uniref:hypothetical protein n=1 Tax=Blastococcus sp. PRF04-17 TaxID=2933797 RepID=UPI001FF63B3A|nr:hypothetical protein [Blastococcus sp. PRF04-17]UOY00911.1 hypothetical protein MVA48_18320 [Blastococcus sp. PRF04-17]
MGERDDRPADEGSEEGPREQLARNAAEGGDPGSVSDRKHDSLIPQEGPDPGIGPD